MAKRGVKAKTARQRRPRPGGASGTPKGWACPGHLSDEARVAWYHVVGLLAEAGNLDRVDPVAVETYAVNAALLRSAYCELEANGGPLASSARGTPEIHPACTVINAATIRLRGLMGDFGLLPTTSKLAPGPRSSGDDRWEGLLNVVW